MVLKGLALPFFNGPLVSKTMVVSFFFLEKVSSFLGGSVLVELGALGVGAVLAALSSNRLNRGLLCKQIFIRILQCPTNHTTRSLTNCMKNNPQNTAVWTSMQSKILWTRKWVKKYLNNTW